MRIGVIGAGYWGSKVISEYHRMKVRGEISEISIFDADTGRLSSINQRFSDVNTFKSPSELMKNVDAVHICSPNETHYELAKMAIRNKLDLLVEKPITVNSTLAHDLVERSLAESVIFQVGNIFRFTNVLPVVKKYLENGGIGEILYINFNWSHYAHGASSSDIDVRWDLLPHVLDICNYLTNNWPSQYYESYSTPLLGRKFPAIARVSGTLHNRVMFFIEVSLCNNKSHKEVEIVGSRGTIYSNPTAQVMRVYQDSKEDQIVVEANNTIEAEISNFIKSVKTRKNTPNSGNLGARIVREIEEIIMVGERNGKNI